MRTTDEIYADIHRQHLKLGTYRDLLPYKHSLLWERIKKLEEEYHRAKQEAWSDAAVEWDEVSEEAEMISDHEWFAVFCDGLEHYYVSDDDICLSVLECDCE